MRFLEHSRFRLRDPGQAKASAKATASPATCSPGPTERARWQGRRRQRRGRLSVRAGAQDRRHRRLALGGAQAAESQGEERRAARRGLHARRLEPARRALAARPPPLVEGSRQAPRRARDAPAFTDDDLRYRQLVLRRRPSTEAVVFFAMDVSSSMTERDRRLAKTFFFWVVQGLRRQYTHIEPVFVAHTVEAWEFAEAEFFQVSGSGGTVASAAFRKSARHDRRALRSCSLQHLHLLRVGWRKLSATIATTPKRR